MVIIIIIDANNDSALLNYKDFKYMMEFELVFHINRSDLGMPAQLLNLFYHIHLRYVGLLVMCDPGL